MHKIFPSIRGLTLLGLASAYAQVAWSQQQPAPPIPALKPPAVAHWIINYTQKDDNKPGATPLPKAGDVLTDDSTGKKAVKLLREEYRLYGTTGSSVKSYSDGSSESFYLVDGVCFFDGKDKKVRTELKSVFSGADARFNEHFPGFDWLKKDYFIETVEKDGKHFLHFRQTPTKHRAATGVDENSVLYYDMNSAEQEREAWIDADTKLPVSFRRGSLIGVYSMSDPPTEQIALPNEVQHAVRSYYGLE